MEASKLKIEGEAYALRIEDFEPADILRILSTIIDLRYQSTIRSLVFSHSMSKFLNACAEFLREAEISSKYTVPDFKLKVDYPLNDEMERGFMNAMQVNFGERYEDFGEEFVNEMKKLYFAPFEIVK